MQSFLEPFLKWNFNQTYVEYFSVFLPIYSVALLTQIAALEKVKREMGEENSSIDCWVFGSGLVAQKFILQNWSWKYW